MKKILLAALLPLNAYAQPEVFARLNGAMPTGVAASQTGRVFVNFPRWGDQVAQWDAVKEAVSEALHAAGGTITHHHAVGRDHRPWYDRQRPRPFADALRAAKAAVDPAGLLNPGVLIDA